MIHFNNEGFKTVWVFCRPCKTDGDMIKVELGGLLYSALNYLIKSDVFTAHELHTNSELIHNCLEKIVYFSL